MNIKNFPAILILHFVSRNISLIWFATYLLLKRIIIVINMRVL